MALETRYHDKGWELEYKKRRSSVFWAEMGYLVTSLLTNLCTYAWASSTLIFVILAIIYILVKHME